VNPLKASWTRKKPVPKEEDDAPDKDRPFLGVRNAATSTSSAEYVLFDIRGVSGAPSGRHKVPYSPGASLRWYLRQLRLLTFASKAAFYDLEFPSRGRLRLRYLPTPDSKILLLPPGLSPSSHLQRSPVDAQEVASKMKT
jgi:hypothetical protein